MLLFYVKELHFHSPAPSPANSKVKEIQAGWWCTCWGQEIMCCMWLRPWETFSLRKQVFPRGDTKPLSTISWWKRLVYRQPWFFLGVGGQSLSKRNQQMAITKNLPDQSSRLGSWWSTIICCFFYPAGGLEALDLSDQPAGWARSSIKKRWFRTDPSGS